MKLNIRVAEAVLLSSLLVCSLPKAQTREQAKQQAEGQLRGMTPQEVENKLAEMGISREEALRKATQNGISLEQYLGPAKGAASPPRVQPSTPIDLPAEEGHQLRAPSVTPTLPPPVNPAGLPYFGYDIFATIPAAFEPTAVGPVDPEYVIGPGDILRVSVWGQVEFQNELTVDKEGRVFISTIGQVLVNGLTLDQTSIKLKRELSRSYSGLTAKNPTVWLDLTLARLRPKRIFLMGEVDKPGGYTVSSYANVFNSLYAVGGPTVKGSLREIRVLRNDKVIAKVDLYDYLLGGEQTNDIRVQNNDIIFIPPRGRSVAIRGAVQRPAVYELKDGEELIRLLHLSGGLLSTAYAPTAQLDRIRPLQQRSGTPDDRIVVDLDLRDVLKPNGRDVKLFDADELQIFPILDEKYNFVTITGSVWRPGRYELGTVKTLRDLIVAAKGIQPRTYTDLAHLVRYNEDLITTRIIPTSLAKVLTDDQYDRRLLPRDEFIIYSTEITEIKNRFVTIRGEVKKPGQYPLRDDMTLEDLIPLAGGYTEAAEVLAAEVSRLIQGGARGDSLALIFHPKIPLIFVPPAAVGQGDSTSDPKSVTRDRFLLRHRDEVAIRPNPGYQLQRDVSIEGDFRYPGTYSLTRRGERLSGLLDRAGGPTSTSYLGGAEFYRGGKRLLLDFMKGYVAREDLHDVVLQAGDRIVVPSHSHTVFVTGEVNKPGLLSYVKGDAVSDYIDRAGGLTDSSWYAILVQPTGESRRVNFGFLRADPDVLEGSTIEVRRENPSPVAEKAEPFSTTIKDIFAIVSAAATITFLVWQTTN